MKKYFLLIVVAFLAVSCIQKQKENEKKTEDAVKTYLQKQLEDAKSYEAIGFTKFDSLKLEDTRLYKEVESEKVEIEASVALLKEKIRDMEGSGRNKVDHLYQELKDELSKAEQESGKISAEFDHLKAKGEDYVYSIKHKFKAKKNGTTDVVVYEEIFYVDRDGNVLEVIEY